jgi:hypothetical protein
MSLTSKERIDILAELGQRLARKDEDYTIAREKAFEQNPWFIGKNIDKAVHAISKIFLNKKSLIDWRDKYPAVKKALSIGLILAGNIPLVGFHDFLSVFVSGHHAQLKLSSRDEVLMKYILENLINIEPTSNDHFEVVERLNGFDAVIATGSNNTSRYFDYYFGKCPNIIRKNRNSVAILTGAENREDLKKLSNDVFDYFGLGCRNVTKLFVPFGYDFKELLQVFDENEAIRDHHKYKNNYDYNYAIYLLNKDEILVSENVILKEDPSYLSRIACLHFEYYEKKTQLRDRLVFDENQIQCIASADGNLLDMNIEVSFGQTQQPGLTDYADGVDTMAFLTALK